jgi:hypothetical protein
MHMRFEFGALPWEVLGRRPVMITLTYPRDWELRVPDSDTLRKHREAFKERWRRKFGTPVGVWVVEFQRRGAPHLHLYLALPDRVSEQEYRALQKRTIQRRVDERRIGKWQARANTPVLKGEFGRWLRQAWWEIVDSQLSVHHGRGVDVATAFFSDEAEQSTNRARVAEYFWRESGKWAQKQPPEDFGPLRFYGRWGQKQGFNPVVTEAEMDERTGLELRRVLLRMREGKFRELDKRLGRPPRRRGRPRGRDGTTVFDIAGREIAPRLLRWAQDLAAQKAAGADWENRTFIAGSGYKWLRAWSEFELMTDEPANEDDCWDGPPDEVDPVEEWLDRQEERERLIEEAADRFMQAQEAERVRQVRQASVRAAQRSPGRPRRI